MGAIGKSGRCTLSRSGASFGNAAFGRVSQTNPNYTPQQYQFALKGQF
jgi:hypothetical protein